MTIGTEYHESNTPIHTPIDKYGLLIFSIWATREFSKRNYFGWRGDVISYQFVTFRLKQHKKLFALFFKSRQNDKGFDFFGS